MTETQRRGRALATFSSLGAMWYLFSDFEHPNTTALAICAAAMVLALILMRRPESTPTSPFEISHASGALSGAAIAPPRQNAASDASVPEGASIAAAAIGLALGFMALLVLGLGGGFADIDADSFLSLVREFAVVAVPVGGFFGFVWPKWSWRWGLVLGWGLLALFALFLAALPFCLAQGCSPHPSDAVPPALAAVFVALLCASAFTGGVIRRRRDT